MADDEAKEEEGSVAKKKGSPLKWVVLLLVIVVAGGGGYIAYGKFLAPKTQQEQASQEKATVTADAKEMNDDVGSMYRMEPYIVNLADSNGRRYLKATIELEMSDDKMRAEMEKKLPMLRDAILILLSSKTFEDISDVQGKMKLREEMERKLNSLVKSGTLRKVYFTEFVVQ